MRFTHSIRMDWLLPGIPPTGKRVEVPFVVIVQFEGDKVAHEHLYWDQASVLVQVGLLDRTLPVRGGEIAAQVLNPTQPMNELIRRALNERPGQQENTMRKSYWLVGTRLSVLAGTAETGGRYDLVEGWFPARRRSRRTATALLRADLRAGRGVHRLGRRGQDGAAPRRRPGHSRRHGPCRARDRRRSGAGVGRRLAERVRPPDHRGRHAGRGG